MVPTSQAADLPDDHGRPVSAEEDVQGTFGCRRTVLAVARTLTSAGRLLEELRSFQGDFRVNVVFTVNDTSRYSAGALELLRAAGVENVVPWSGVGRLSYALAISASENIDFEAVHGPVVVLPHGVGFNKYVPDPERGRWRLAGLPPAEVLRTGRVRVVLAHSDQARQLRTVAPEAARHTEVVGDPTYDRLRLSLPLRDHYRRALGLDGRTLVFVSSTWRAESAIGQRRRLPLDLLAELPSDEYRVALALHPNVWSWYSSLQIRTWFQDAMDAGLLLLPPEQGWHAALVAAHVVIADHGSLGLYGAALGKPLLLAAFGAETVEDTPIARLGREATPLDPRRSSREQIEHALREHDPDRFADLTRDTFGNTGDAAHRLRDLLYRELDLDPPIEQPPLTRPPEADPYRRPVTSFDVHADVAEDGGIRLRRFPSSARRAEDDLVESPRHVAVAEDEPLLRRFGEASVVVRRDVDDSTEAARWTAWALDEFPGALVTAAATRTGCLAGVRGGVRFHVTTTPPRDTMLLASVVHVCVVRGGAVPGHRTVRLGGHEFDVTLTRAED